MKIKFYAHASFRIEGDGLAVVTDPYTPGSQASHFDPIDEPADIVIRSSPDDRFHNDPSHIMGNPVVVDALHIGPEGTSVKGLHIRAFPTAESKTFDFGRPAMDNAMYTFTIEGIRMFHMGDVGNPLSDEHLAALRSSVDVMFALTGGHATIALDDLDVAIKGIRPSIVIPMHYHSDRGVLNILPVKAFTDRYPKESVIWAGGSEMIVTRDTLPTTMQIHVLQQCR